MVISNEYYTGFTSVYYKILTFGCIIITLICYFLVGCALLIQSKALKKFLKVPNNQDLISVVPVSFVNKKVPARRKRRNWKEIVQVEKTLILPYFMGVVVAIITQITIFVKFQEPTRDIVKNFLLTTQFIVSPLLLLCNSDQVRKQLSTIIKWIFKRKSSNNTQTPVTKF
uniref:Uncharacterized protein n=1 Tax=Acrobeloides nanus TaxID=290746 RepID=A0A914BVV4_9BILA